MLTGHQAVTEAEPAVKQVVFGPEVSEKALQPAGRNPHQVVVRMWDWYTGLPGPES